MSAIRVEKPLHRSNEIAPRNSTTRTMPRVQTVTDPPRDHLNRPRRIT